MATAVAITAGGITDLGAATTVGGACAKGVASTEASAAGGLMLGAASLVWAAVPGGDAVPPKGLKQNPVKSGLVSTCGTGS
jgi:hypothetical protein